MQSRILVTGGGGKLARELIRIDSTIDAPTRQQLDFSTYEAIDLYCKEKRYDVIIHAGAVTNKSEKNVDEEYVQSNIIGTANMVLWAKRHNVRLIYVSSDYVYPSERGGYTEESVLLPVNHYARSKLGGEMAVQLYDNSLVVRTSFYSALNFDRACADQHTSRIPIRVAAQAIYDMAQMKNLCGIINLGTKTKRSLYEIVKNEFNPSVELCKRADIRIAYPLPGDSSLDTTRYQLAIDSSLRPSRHVASCRICRSGELYKYLDLGLTPLANAYLNVEDLTRPEFKEELVLQVCLNCGLSQLTKVVHPERMFKNYLYVSSTTQTFRDHCAELAQATTSLVSAKTGDLVLDIASNDGCLLSRFQQLGMNVLGVDPAENLALEANASGIRTLNIYWSKNIARDIISRFGSPKIITATNVLAHVDDIHEFVEAVELCLARKGIFAVECPYLMDFIENNEFDTAYHEHLSYLAVTPLSSLMKMHDLQIFDIQYFKEIHGGTIRLFVCRENEYPLSKNVYEYTKKEETFGIKTQNPYDSFAQRVLKNKKNLREVVMALHSEGKKIWAYGAGAKGNMLMNFFEITKDIVPVVIDDNPKKWEYYTPGSQLQITSISKLTESSVDYLLLLAWNFQKEIIQRCKTVSYSGKYIVPVPVARIISNND